MESIQCQADPLGRGAAGCGAQWPRPLPCPCGEALPGSRCCCSAELSSETQPSTCCRSCMPAACPRWSVGAEPGSRWYSAVAARNPLSVHAWELAAVPQITSFTLPLLQQLPGAHHPSGNAPTRGTSPGPSEAVVCPSCSPCSSLFLSSPQGRCFTETFSPSMFLTQIPWF